MIVRRGGVPAAATLDVMQTYVITFRLTGMTDDGYREACSELAPAFAELPGLLAKIWLADPGSGTYGGVYLFADDDAADAFAASQLYRTVTTFPHFTGVTVQRFTVDETTTRRTQPGLPVVPPVVSTVAVAST